MLSNTMQRANAGSLLNIKVSPPTGNPGLAGPGTVGCRIPRSQLIKTTSAEAATLSDLSGRLITGNLTVSQNVVGTDFIIEARGNHTNMIDNKSGTVNFEWVTISGLELDDNDQPVKAYEINAGAAGARVSLRRAEIMYINDGFRIGSGCSLTESYIHSHTLDYDSKGTEQHRDGAQSTRGSSIRVEDNLFDNRTAPCPFPNGTWVGTYSKAASSSMITNHDAPYTGWVRFNRNRSIGGSAMHVNLVAGLDDGDYTDWSYPVYDGSGNLIRGFECKDNISLEDGQYNTIFCNKQWKYFNFIDPSNRRFDANGVEGPWTYFYKESGSETTPIIKDTDGQTIIYRQNISVSEPHSFSLSNTDGVVTAVRYLVGRTGLVLGQSASTGPTPIDFSVINLDIIPYNIISIRVEYDYTDVNGATQTDAAFKPVRLLP